MEDVPSSVSPPGLASIGRRIVARLIDSAMFAIPAGAYAATQFPRILRIVERNPTPEQASAELGPEMMRFFLVIAVAQALYEVLLTAAWGQTLGKRIMRIRVVRIPGGTIPGWNTSLVRWAVHGLPGFFRSVPVIGGLAGVFSILAMFWAIWDPRRQGLHDKAASTLVIRTDSGPATGATGIEAPPVSSW